MIQEHYESAKRWIEWIHGRSPNFLWESRTASDYGDWLNGEHLGFAGYPRKTAEVPKDVFSTAFFAYSTHIVAQMAKVLGRKDEADKYGNLFERIKAAFNKAYVDAEGRIQGDTQAGYALALHFNLIDETLRAKAVEHLLEAIQKYNGHVSTGIHTGNRLMLELSRNGRHEEACRLINLRTVPSWGYMVEMGATTIWERWDGYVKGKITAPSIIKQLKPLYEGFDGYVDGAGPWGGFHHPDMNSFNHMSQGSVGEWIWRELAGINLDESQPGYKHFFIRPRPCGDLTWVKARYDSIRGPIEVEWKIIDGRFALDIKVPANTTATVFVPTGSNKVMAEGTEFVRMEDGMAVFAVGSGRYHFQAERQGDSS
jgi:alpha-L-rhamnosidase